MEIRPTKGNMNPNYILNWNETKNLVLIDLLKQNVHSRYILHILALTCFDIELQFFAVASHCTFPLRLWSPAKALSSLAPSVSRTITVSSMCATWPPGLLGWNKWTWWKTTSSPWKSWEICCFPKGPDPPHTLSEPFLWIKSKGPSVNIRKPQFFANT